MIPVGELVLIPKHHAEYLYVLICTYSYAVIAIAANNKVALYDCIFLSRSSRIIAKHHTNIVLACTQSWGRYF